MRKPVAGTSLGLAAAAIVLALALAGVFDAVELDLYDWRIRQAADPSSAHPGIALVLIDDQTIRDLEPVLGRWPWPRLAHSLFVSYLNRAPAKLVAFDIGFWDRDISDHEVGGRKWTGTESDQVFVEAVREAGNVILLADAAYSGSLDQQTAPPAWRDPGYTIGPRIEERPMVLAPFEPLVSAAAGIGHNFLPLDEGGSTARRMPPFVRAGDRYVPSLGLASALQAMGVQPGEVRLDGRTLLVRDRRIPLTSVPVTNFDGSGTHEQLSMLINFRGPADDPGYKTYSARYLLNAENQIQSGEKPDLDPAEFKDKIVFIGTSAAGAHDVFQTPFSSANMAGIQLHASMADSLMADRFIGEAPGFTRPLVVVIAAVATALLAIFLSYTWGVAAALALALAWTAASVLLFERGMWVNLSQPLAGIGLALFATTAYRYFVEDRAKREVQKLFGRYVSKDVYAELIAHPDRAALGGKRREMSVLFSDIRGFTTVTESGQPEELVAQLNEYFSVMVDVVFRHGGTVDKFVGDMVMALFGAPLEDPKHADHAVAASVEMVRELAELNRKWAEAGQPVLDIGVGVNSGEMIAGNIGSSSIMSYTVIGDNVNLGSRLESLNKEYKTRIIISDATRRRLTDRYELRPLGDVVVKGKTLSVAIFEVQVPSPLPPDVQAGMRRTEKEAPL